MNAPPVIERDLLGRLRGATGDLAFTRAQVQRFYDDWLAGSAFDGAPACFVHAVVSGVDAASHLPNPPHPARDGDALCLALAALGTPDRILQFFGAAVAAGLFDGTTAAEARAARRRKLTAGMQAALGLESTRAVLQHGTREALTAPDALWFDPGDLLPAIILARRRLCRIESTDDNETPVTGSGFLVGPSTVMTNFHVVKHLPETLADGARLRVTFDYSATTGLAGAESSVFPAQPDWRAAMSPLAATGPEEDYWWDDKTKRDAWLAEVAKTLDYAVIRLDGAPGLQRGWYRIDDIPTETPTAVWVLHHPGTEGHTITDGPVRLTKPGGHRIFHLASTAKGSSGGLVLNQEGAPVGLHFMALEANAPPAPNAPNQKNQVLNVAVALSAIARDLTEKALLPKVSEPSGIRPYRGCLDGRRPVFGRESYLRLMERIFRGEPQMLMVHVESRDPPLFRPGKTFSANIVQALFRPPEHHHIVFRAGDIKVDAYQVAVDTVTTFAADQVGRLPTKPDTTSPAYVRRLVGAVGQIIAERLSNKLVWITLDDLDKHDLSDASGREFLATLYNQIKQMPNLRILLIGLPEGTTIGGMDEADVARSFITERDLDGLATQLTDWLKMRGGRDSQITDQAFSFLAAILTSVADTDAPLAALADFVAEHVSGAADTFFGKATGRAAEDGG